LKLNLDLHVHSVYSGDSPVEPAEYARLMIEMRAEYDLSGFVLMEHNHFITREECDLEKLSKEHGLVILSGVEVDTYWGHLLVYNMTESLWSKIQENNARKQEPVALAKLAAEEGAVCVPAHPFRFFIGMGERCRELEGISAVETLNGSNSEQENRQAVRLAARTGWGATGGSDAHFKAELGKALTRFQNPIRSMDDLAREIKAGRCEALTLEDVGLKD